MNIRTRSSFKSDGSDEQQAFPLNSQISEENSEEEKLEQPWHFWKWLIPIYASILCVSVLLTLSYWMTVIKSTEFLLYIGDDDKVIWGLLPTMPTACMVVEYPFNMIPMDWPMLFFVELLFLFYIFVNFIVVSAEENHTNIYDAFNWYEDPIKAIGDVMICMAVLALIFAIFWLVT